MGNCIENPRTSCALGGALAVAASLERTIPIFHAGPGCGLQVSVGQRTGYIGGIGCPSTNMFEKEVVFGGAQRLRETIEGSIEVMDGDLYVVLTGCTAGIIGDDVEEVVNEFKVKGVPIVNVDTAGFKGDTYYGYEAVFNALVDNFTEKVPKEEKTVNVFGIVPHQDVFWLGNIEELTRILKRLGLKVNTFFTEHQGLKEIRSSAAAAINIIFSPWLLEEVSELYKTKYGIETLRYPGIPIGPTETSNFIRNLSEKLNLDKLAAERVIEEEEDYVYGHFERIIGAISKYRFIVIGDVNTVIGITKFLVNDYSQIPLLAIITDDIPENYRSKIEEELLTMEYGRKPKVVFEADKWEISKLVRAYENEATLLLGSSLDKEIADELDIFSSVISYPSTGTFIINKGYAGYKGCLTFLEDLYNRY